VTLHTDVYSSSEINRSNAASANSKNGNSSEISTRRRSGIITLTSLSAVHGSESVRHHNEVKDMKTFATLLLIAAAILATHFVSAAGQNDRPPAVAERDWIQISERFGFVVTPSNPLPAANQPRQLLVVPPEARSRSASAQSRLLATIAISLIRS
jgi:hypothetical protein